MGCRKLLIPACIALLEITGCKQHSNLPYYNTADFTPAWNEDNTGSHSIPAFSFTDQDNKTISDKTFDNKIYIANFFFSTCGSICPLMTKNLLKVQQAFPGNEHIGFLSHTVMPWIDSTGKLKKYSQRFGLDQRWHLVTGSQGEIYKLARQSYFAEEEPGFTKDSTEFLHTEHVLLIDKNKHIRGVYNGTLELEINRLTDDVKLLLEEENF
jgi:protein SCO1/2